MKRRLIQFIIITSLTLVLILGFYFFFPQVWGEVLYPLEYQDSIAKYAKERNLDPNFVCAVIYTESRFHKDSVSGAGATGLMQIMPATGRGIADRLGEPMGNLLDPDTNIKYGTQYLREQLDTYNNDVDLVLAAYNAGGGRAVAWRLYGESLPLETVGFISKVKNTKDMYDKIYGMWWANSGAEKPNPFYQGITNFQDFVKELILGT
jgi:soluble lytic murein transglycosylase